MQRGRELHKLIVKLCNVCAFVRIISAARYHPDLVQLLHLHLHHACQTTGSKGQRVLILDLRLTMELS